MALIPLCLELKKQGFGQPAPQPEPVTHAQFMFYISNNPRLFRQFLKIKAPLTSPNVSDLEKLITSKSAAAQLRQFMDGLKLKYRNSDIGQLLYMYCDRVDQETDYKNIKNLEALLVSIMEGNMPDDPDEYVRRRDKRRG